MLYRCPYEDGHVYVCCMVERLARPVPWHGKKSGYVTECIRTLVKNELNFSMGPMWSASSSHSPNNKRIVEVLLNAFKMMLSK